MALPVRRPLRVRLPFYRAAVVGWDPHTIVPNGALARSAGKTNKEERPDFPGLSVFNTDRHEVAPP